MTPQEFIAKWRGNALRERAAAHEHFIDLCRLLGVATPKEADPNGEWYAFEKGAAKTGGGDGWADVWKRNCFAWEYKSPGKDLKAALRQLLQYQGALNHPPLLIVSDMEVIEVHTAWTYLVRETRVFTLDDLLDGRRRDTLRKIFSETEVDAFKPGKARAEVTAQVAQEFVILAQNLRARGHDAEQVAHFVNRMLFCMFAEDVGLLPDKLFTKLLKVSERQPDRFQEYAKKLFGQMRTGGDFDLNIIEWFNGGLFDDDTALPLQTADIRTALKAAEQDWSEIDPSIMGTLFERGLDPDKRSQLGAHYTDPEKIMMIIRPVIIEPLTREWEAARAEIEAELAKRETARSTGARTQAMNRARERKVQFLEKLRGFRVLDPACGSGNFLYLSLKALKDIEHRVNTECEALGLPRDFPAVGPENMLGIEINPFAAELARVSVWVGEIQWMREHGFDASRNPVLRPLDTIQCRNALLDADGTEAEWPEVDVVIGNPPFLGGKSMRGTIGDEGTKAIRGVYGNRIAAFSDLVCYWFEKSRDMISRKRAARCGLVATKAIAKNANLPVLLRLASDTTIFNAWQNEPWVVDGAAVRVSVICFGASELTPYRISLNGKSVERINPNLTSGLDTSLVSKLQENRGSMFIGIQQSGPFSIARETAEQWLLLPANPNGKGNCDVLSSYASTDDIVGRPTDTFLIDFPSGLNFGAASAFEKPFEYLRHAMYDPLRDGKLVQFTHYRKSTSGQNANWWEAHRPRQKLRTALCQVASYVATAETTEHRVFRFLSSELVPDKSLYSFPRAGFVGFGLLQSYAHEHWCTYFGNRIGAGNQRRYNGSYVYLTFPFPEGLTPNIPAADYAGDPRAIAIAAAARTLNDLREGWLNPPDLVMRVPEVVPGYPDRIIAVDDKAEKVLRKRTLTNLYNERPAWLDNAHRELDRAVAHAYGWTDWGNDGLADDVILERLFRLNQERAAAGR